MGSCNPTSTELSSSLGCANTALAPSIILYRPDLGMGAGKSANIDPASFRLRQAATWLNQTLRRAVQCKIAQSYTSGRAIF